jgi:hypothetical protein
MLEGLVTPGELDETALLVAMDEGVLGTTDGKVDVPTLLVEVLVGNVEAGVEADWQSKPTLWMPTSQPSSLP